MPEMIFSKRFAAGEEIFRVGDRGRNAYIIERGSVGVSVIATARPWSSRR
ncbi:MAG: hypothetical protein O7G13_16245 [Alphaproteobacteria bacterium]|jgi:CRP-like cAMP-binding protein|nr:hypothetical protein [Alphaproteobacteria bacterium]